MSELPVLLSDLRLLRQIIESSTVGTVVTDALQDDQPIVFVNPAFERLSGYSAAELLGRNCRLLQGHDHDQAGVGELRQAIGQQQSVTVTLRNYRRDGTLFYNELTLSPVRDPAGTVTHFVGFQNDVTAREEARLHEAQLLLQLTSTLGRMTDGFVSLDRNLNLIYLNAAAASISGKRPEDLTGHDLLTTFPELADTDVFRAITRAAKTGAVQNAVSHMEPYGTIDVTVYPAEDGIAVFTRNVTQQHQLQKELRVSEERFSKVFQASPMPIVITHWSDQRLIDVNEAFLLQVGCQREEIVGRTFRESGIWDDNPDHDRLSSALHEVDSVRSLEVHLRTRSGKALHLVISMVRVELDGGTCVVSLARDVTLERAAQRVLVESEQRYRRIAAQLQRTLDLSLDMITSFDAEGRFVTVSAACQQILGYTPEELLGRPYLDFVHPDDRSMAAREDASITAGTATLAFQNRYLHRSGAVVWIEWVAVVLPGDPVMYCVARDITARRAAEEDQAYLAAIVQASQDAILGVSLDGTIRSWNAGAEQLYGYPMAEAVGQPVTLIVPPERRGEEVEMLRRAGRGESPGPFEAVRVAKDGRQIPVFVTVSPIRDAVGEVIGVSKIAQDITERHMARAEIQRLNEYLQQQLRHVTGLREIDQAIASTQELSVTLGMILDNIAQELGVDAVTLLLLDPYTLNLEYASTRGFTTPLQGSTVRVGTGLAGEVALSRKALSVPDLQTAPISPAWRGVLLREQLMNYYGAPLLAKGKVLGVMEVLHRQPFEPSASWLATFEMLTAQAAIAVDNDRLFTELDRKNLELRLAYDETIEGWARALDLRDKETEGHSRRVTEMTVELCRQLGLSSDQLVDVRRGALLHDIGKMAIPDAILLKPGKLTDEEWVEMKKHPGYAVELLSPIKFLRPVLDIPQYHHEKWDGSGYPFGLRGEAIPLTARAFAAVDVYDALTSDRPYRAAWTRERALAHIQSGSGTHFDPRIVQDFFELLAVESRS
ncbi:PAS domain S-box protein [Deinococcus hopiensis]|uniref:PAS domain S-box-containing protein/HDIG domain-containing protein n=1 Tax=Deinococcus hopiensis KR-140 TaxID=695939 RepID=A0A1W1UPG1_9DEIO|nr:PAS domain S-box protein [Deinococcus hopiensis]SMB82956.1 PAS domain S-box-containing protein/HDIG domain-containing protein [Deinococcus hopiensis KR-140]